MRPKASASYRSSVPSFWTYIEKQIVRYQRWLPRYGAVVVDLWVLVRGILVALTVYMASSFGTTVGIVACVIASVLLLELLAYSTGVVIQGPLPASIVRFLVLAFVGYLTVGLCFSVYYVLQIDSFNKSVNSVDVVYFSVVTLATIGYGDLHVKRGFPIAEMTVVAEHLVGLYYVAVVLAVVVSMVNARGEPTPRSDPWDERTEKKAMVRSFAVRLFGALSEMRRQPNSALHPTAPTKMKRRG